MEQTHIILLGTEDWSQKYRLAEGVTLTFETALQAPESGYFDLVILDKTPNEEEIQILFQYAKTYCMFATENVDIDACRLLILCKQAYFLNDDDIDFLLGTDSVWFYPGHYGEKFSHEFLAVSPFFTGKVHWSGNYALQTEGNYGSEFNQIAFWKNNIPLFQGQTIDFWLEYRAQGNVEIALELTLLSRYDYTKTLKHRVYSQRELENIIHMTTQEMGWLFVSVLAKGQGSLDIISLHDRYSRGSFGYFLPGGERYVTSQREEIFAYFDPGDLQPPLNIYFSGYKTKEGFEGYNMMRNMGAPFLLIAECRLEGGSFYIGSDEYEQLMVSVIRSYLDKLGFDRDQVIFSGISMGTTGALYYGCDFRPHAVLVGKPLTNLGTVAANEKRNRPGGFPTSLDLLRTQTGGDSQIDIEVLNRRFWDKFNRTDWSESKIIASYMLEDDYDHEAYQQMVESLSRQNGQIYGRGLHGRHNDNTYGVVQWFTSQFQKILREDFPTENSPLREGE